MEMVAVIYRTKNFSGSVGQFFLEVLAKAPRGKARELVCRSRDDGILRSYRALRVKRSKPCKGDTCQQYDEGPAQTKRGRR
jgi:hypothetical protein